MMKGLYIIAFSILFSINAFAQNATHVWIVRHAEKQTLNKSDQNPSLSEDGLQRAEDLKTYLKKNKIKHVFVTPYKRSEETAAPLVKAQNLGIEFYKPTDTAFISQRVKQELAGKHILIVGHSNTVMPIIETLGGSKPFKELKEDDYDYIFYLKIKGKKVKVKSSNYGRLQHSSII